LCIFVSSLHGNRSTGFDLIKNNAMRLPAFVLLLISFFFVKFARSQSNELLIQGQTGKLYLEHTVVAKENWYSIGRLYNANPKEIAPFNHLAMTKPLSVGQTIQIPLTAVNFSQNDKKIASETLVPLYHIIQEKEWFYRISINHNKVPIPSLEKWNNINKDQAKAGMHLIVGFLKVKTALSALATRSAAPATAFNNAVSNPTTTTPVNPSTGANPPAGANSATTTSLPAAGNPHSSVRPPAGNNLPASTNPSTTANLPQVPTPRTSGNPSTSSPSANTKTSQPAAPVNPNPQPATTNTATTAAVPAIHFNGGFFKTDFSETGKSGSGPAGTFKSTSGWQDGKYYALMNNIAIGTIVKVSVPGTDKSIYAKILGQLPDMKESAGLTIRISNAAASELGTGEGRFTVEVKY